MLSGEIDWGNLTSDDGFEIVEHVNLDITLKDTEIVVEESGVDGAIATGTDALCILDNPKTRDQFMNDLMELEAFLKMRLFDMSNESDLLTMSQMQNAPVLLQMQTLETIVELSYAVQVVLNEMANKRVQHLHNIKHSPKYIDLLTSSLNQKLAVVERLKASKSILETKCKEARTEALGINSMISSIIENTRILQKHLQDDISKKYKGRPVNIVGGVNML